MGDRVDVSDKEAKLLVAVGCHIQPACPGQGDCIDCPPPSSTPMDALGQDIKTLSWNVCVSDAGAMSLDISWMIFASFVSCGFWQASR